jgi:TonB family protein
MRLIDFPDTIDLAFDKTELLQDGREEPLFLAAAVADIPEATRLDPTRIDLNPETAPPRRSAWRGSIGSLLLHLLPLLALISWLRPPLEMPKPIPVQLVIEQPPPPPPAKAPPHDKPPPGLRASDDFGEVGPPSAQKGADTTPPTEGEALPPVAQAPAAPTPPEPPAEPPPSAQAQSALTPSAPPVESPPTAQGQTALTPPEPPVESPKAAPVMLPPVAPKPTPPNKPPPPKQQMAALPRQLEGLELPLPLHPDRPHQASASARYPGPDATRDEYCVYALKLTMEHVDLLPLSLLGARRGDTAVTIRLREDGTIVNAMVAQGSGYLDIDEKVAEMVRAVGRFPPLPLWLPGPTADFTFRMHFPNPSER